MGDLHNKVEFDSEEKTKESCGFWFSYVIWFQTLPLYAKTFHIDMQKSDLWIKSFIKSLFKQSSQIYNFENKEHGYCLHNREGFNPRFRCSRRKLDAKAHILRFKNSLSYSNHIKSIRQEKRQYKWSSYLLRLKNMIYKTHLSVN